MAGSDNPLKRQMGEWYRGKAVSFSFFRGDWDRKEESLSKVSWLLSRELEEQSDPGGREGKVWEGPMRK